MTSHPSESQLQDLLDDELTGELAHSVRLHVEGCDECRMKLASTRALLDELKSLSTEAQKAPIPWNPSMQRAPSTFSSRFLAIAAAAAIAIFTAGILTGMSMRSSSASMPLRFSNQGREQVTEEIQHSGTMYVTAIARWRRQESSTAGATQGREAAIATLYGAAFELQKVQPADRRLANVVRSIHDLRDLNLETKP